MTRSGRHRWVELWVSPHRPKGQRDHVNECRHCGLRQRKTVRDGYRRTVYYWPWQRLCPAAHVESHTPKCPGRKYEAPFVPWTWVDHLRQLRDGTARGLEG